MKMKTISKLLAASIFTFAASASQAASVTEWDVLVDMSWNTDTYKFVKGDETYNPRQYDFSVTDYEVVWGYNGYKNNGELDKKNPVDYTKPYSNDNYTSSALVIKQDSLGQQRLSANGTTTTTSTITFYNNFLDEDHIVPQSLSLNLSIDLTPVGGASAFSVDKSFELYYERFNVEYKNGKIHDIDHGSGYVILPGDIAYSFSEGGYDYTVNFGVDGGKLSNKCGKSGFDTCYVIGKDINKGKLDKSNINFTTTITAVQSPVPEPEAYAMLLAGLGMIGMVSRRRRNSIRN